MIMTEKITLGMYHIVVPFLALHTPGPGGVWVRRTRKGTANLQKGDTKIRAFNTNWHLKGS